LLIHPVLAKGDYSEGVKNADVCILTDIRLLLR
jgi:hypothetical protein